MKVKHQEVVWTLAFLAIISQSTAHISSGHIGFQNIDPKVYCGRNLANILEKLCTDEGVLDKRSNPGRMYNTILSPYYKEHDVGWPWKAHHKTLGFPSRGKRYQDDYGIVNECCEKPCSIDELLQYCY